MPYELELRAPHGGETIRGAYQVQIRSLGNAVMGSTTWCSSTSGPLLEDTIVRRSEENLMTCLIRD